MGRRAYLALAIMAGLPIFVMSGKPASAQALVNTTWLRQHLNDTNLVVIDVFDDDQRTQFAAEHIPGARIADFTHDGWRAKVGAAPGMLPPIKDAEKLIGSFGIDNHSHVVLVPGGRDKGDFNASARVYWTFKALGHDDVSILEGGDKAWFADRSNPVATGPAAPTQPRTFVAHFRPEYLATREEVKDALRTGDVQLVDARPPAQYEGKVKSPVDRVAGTLPGAVNVPAEQLVTADGTRRADATIVDRLIVKAGAKTAGKQIAFCNTGHLAAGTWFLLHEIKGNNQAKLYAGSMSDWTSDPALPVGNEPHS